MKLQSHETPALQLVRHKEVNFPLFTYSSHLVLHRVKDKIKYKYTGKEKVTELVGLKHFVISL